MLALQQAVHEADELDYQLVLAEIVATLENDTVQPAHGSVEITKHTVTNTCRYLNVTYAKGTHIDFCFFRHDIKTLTFVIDPD